jgi:Ca2+-binding RTX toxin-like protein
MHQIENVNLEWNRPVTVVGTDGRNRIRVSTANHAPVSELIRGRGGADRISTGLGDDRVFGGRGNDQIKGSGGDDTLSGGQGADDIFGSNGDDVLDGGPDIDTLHGGPGTDTCTNGELLFSCP